MALFLFGIFLTGCAVESTNPPGSGMDKEKIRTVVQSHLKEIKICYEHALNLTPKLAGKLVILWTIGPDGKVLEAHVKNSTLNSADLETCTIDRFKTWLFPNPPAGETAEVSYPFIFRGE